MRSPFEIEIDQLKMAERTISIFQQQTKPIKICKWKIRTGTRISIGCPILIYDFEEATKPEQRKLKSTQAGTVHQILVLEGQIVKPGEVLLELIPCSHPTIMNDMCAECGADLRKNDDISIASVPMIHAIPDLKVSEEVAQRIGKADNERLLKDRKLVLLVDLDQTLIHTTNDNIPPNIKDVYHFQLHGSNSPWYHTRLRPGTHKFLRNIHDYYELHICTFGARNYAHMIAMFLDADQNIFSNRILSRDECFDPTSKKANLSALFPCGDNMVCIIDDREDVWSHATNLIHVKPYHFFQHTGDINAPPGLDKHENDKLVKGIDLTKVSTKKNNTKVTSEENDNSSRDVETNPEDKEDKTVTDDKTVSEEKTVTEDKTITEDKTVTEDKIVSEEKTVTDNGNSEEDKTSKLEENANKDEVENNSQCKTENKETVDEESKKQEADKHLVNNKDDEKDVEKKNNENAADENMNENSEITKTKPEEPKNNETESNSENKNSDKENKKDKSDKSEKPEELIDIDDPDDYLIYLEEILKHIHQEFYKQYDELEAGEVPDLKQVIPTVRSNILEGCRLVFSGLVPTHINLEQSKAYLVARGLGATVTQDIEDTTTHLVAVRPGTAKVNSGRRKKKLKIVTPDWLWCCAERWEHVDERIFPLNSKGSKNRHPPPHCSSPEHITSYPEHGMPDTRKRTPSGKFMDTINPLMSFSSDDIADMDKEVEDILEDDDSESSEEDIKQDFGEKMMSEILSKTSNESSSSSEDSLTGEYPRGYKRKKFEPNADDLYNSIDEDEDESPSVKFRRGENVHDMLDYEQDDTQDSIEPVGDVDDGEWNMMGAALEREFLSNN
ncbi:RNA polymerase II subunit A C-terminal domain phosphatase isoform X2 [Diabrotica virgifera virgifera]|uniref:RNA polymerase II subunit A C-terminal domain phosphatase n=1 Tax=Diabrotica virgifera virgifera TaxID=50390 RepID=A0A6P7GP76_DIAVI|nr:RNA polymerase II subunit A C-terminal domain phosphatase isoform X2 [Diabrotica virgifera virgifera]